MDLSRYDDVVEDARNLVEAKSKKYHGTDDILTSWRATSKLTGVSIEMLLITRIYEKLQRIATMLKENASDKAQDDLGESLMDSTIDLLNYDIFLALALKEKQLEARTPHGYSDLPNRFPNLKGVRLA